MGCGTSTLMSENADIQAKVRPIVRRRINDLKRRRRGIKDSTPSKKELLAGEDFDKTSMNNDSLGSKGTPSSEHSLDRVAGKIVPVLEEEEEEEEKTMVLKKEEILEKGKNAEESHIYNQPEIEENEDDDDDEGRRISPGSPSFRFYCVESVPHDPYDDNNGHDSHSKNLEAKTAEGHSASQHAETDLQQRDSAARSLKGKVNRRFKSVIPKSGQVKSLLNVKSCYNPACSGGHDKAHLLQQAAA